MTSLRPCVAVAADGTTAGTVQKPARYIGCEDGAINPGHAPGKGAWLLAYPDTYEVGLPNQGLQILYEILNERDDAVAERTYAPWTDLEACCAATASRCSRSTPTARRAIRPDRLQPLRRARLHERPQHGRPRRRTRAQRDRRPEHPLVVAGGHGAFNPEPLADFIDLFVLGEGEEVVGEITEVVGEWKAAAGPTARGRRAPRPGPDPRRLRAVDVRRAYDGPRLRRVTPRYRRRPGGDRQAHDRRPRRVAVPEAPAGTADRGRPRPPQRRGVPWLHPRLPLLPGRDDHPAGARAAGRPGSHDGRDGPAPHRLRRGQPDVAVDRRLLRHRAVIGGVVDDPASLCGPTSVSLPSLRVDAFTVGLAARSQRAAQRPHVRPRSRLVAAAVGHQQADHRGRPLRRRRIGLRRRVGRG